MKCEKTVAELFREKIESKPDLMEVVKQDRRRVFVAEQIRAIRKSLKMSQKELADKIGSAQSAISRIESANYRGHALKTLERIAAALEVDVWVVFGPKPKRAKMRRRKAGGVASPARRSV